MHKFDSQVFKVKIFTTLKKTSCLVTDNVSCLKNVTGNKVGILVFQSNPQSVFTDFLDFFKSKVVAVEISVKVCFRIQNFYVSFI